MISETIELRVARSAVGLRAVKDCPVRWRDFAKDIRPGERLATILDREYDLGFLRRRSRQSSVVKNKLPSELVEGASQTMDKVTQEYGHTQAPLDRHHRNPKDIISFITVEFDAQSDLISFTVEDGLNLVLESVAMFVRPLNLGPDSTKVDSHD